MLPVSATEYIPLGDINQDGIVSLYDVRLVLEFVSGVSTPDYNEFAFADADENGYLSIDDARLVLKIAAKIKKQPKAKISAWQIVSESTCLKAGLSCAYTLKGNNYITKALPKKSHTVVSATCTRGKHCSVCDTYFSEPLGHTTQNGFCERCRENISDNPLINIDGRLVYFGDSADTLKEIFGAPAEILSDIIALNRVEYYVYPSDYSRLTVFTVSRKQGVIGVYSVDPTYKIVTSELTVSYNNVNDYEFSDGVYFKAYIDSLGTGDVYAFYATVDDNSLSMHPTTNFRSCEKLNFHLVNSCRALNDAEPTKYSAEIGAVALAHSKDMADNNYFDHINLRGEAPIDRLKKADISFSLCGENIVAGYPMNIYDFNDAWYNSSGHRAIMLTKEFRKLGIGIAYNNNSEYLYYATQNYTS